MPATYQILYFIAWKPGDAQVLFKIQLYLDESALTDLTCSQNQLREEAVKSH